MAAEKKKFRYVSKKVRFGTKELTLYSIDGNTWSSRKDELVIIQERHEAERQKLVQNVGEARLEEVVVEKPEAAADDTVALVTVGEDDGDSAENGAKKGKPAAKSKGVAKQKINPKSSKDRVQFVAPKPRQLEKKRKAAKARKKAA